MLDEIDILEGFPGITQLFTNWEELHDYSIGEIHSNICKDLEKANKMLEQLATYYPSVKEVNRNGNY